MMKCRIRRGTIWALVAALLAVSGVPQLARTLSGSVFAKPLDWGTVDFGDRVLYQLEGSGCIGEQVAVVVGGGGRAEAVGESSAAAADPLQPGACVGIATVPVEAAVRSTGWDDGDAIEIRLESSDDAVTLRYQRVEVDLGEPAAGAPVSETPPVADPRGGANDEAMSMSTGDVVSLGRVDLTHIYSVSRTGVRQRSEAAPHPEQDRVASRKARRPADSRANRRRG